MVMGFHRDRTPSPPDSLYHRVLRNEPYEKSKYNVKILSNADDYGKKLRSLEEQLKTTPERNYKLSNYWPTEERTELSELLDVTGLGIEDGSLNDNPNYHGYDTASCVYGGKLVVENSTLYVKTDTQEFTMRIVGSIPGIFLSVPTMMLLANGQIKDGLIMAAICAPFFTFGYALGKAYRGLENPHSLLAGHLERRAKYLQVILRP